VYHEARGEPRAGQVAVARVIINRTKSGRYPTSICGVVYQPSQFSALKPGMTPSNVAQWRTAQAVADDALQGEGEDRMQGAMYFHASYVRPGWNRVRVAAIGNHVFYR
jgi:spore germination cell wall hydrolase CwlJ-like protein